MAAAAASPASSPPSFAKRFPATNASLFCAVSAGLSDVTAQVVVEGKSILPSDEGKEPSKASSVDWSRNAVFCLFGGIYLGAFQYVYQVHVFRRLFGRAQLERFTSQSWAAKLRDGPGLRSLAMQVMLDIGMLSCVYLPTFYTFKAAVFSTSGSSSNNAFPPRAWVSDGVNNWLRNISSDALDMARFWGPADLACFSVALHYRLPLRSVFSFAWTTYLSVIRGGEVAKEKTADGHAGDAHRPHETTPSNNPPLSISIK